MSSYHVAMIFFSYLGSLLNPLVSGAITPPHKALCSRLQNTDSRNRKFSQFGDAAFQIHNRNLTATPKACGINLQKKLILQWQGS